MEIDNSKYQKYQQRLRADQHPSDNVSYIDVLLIVAEADR